MKRVEKITRLVTGNNPYPEIMRKELIKRFGCDGQNGNFIINGEYPHSLIITIGHFISKHHGKLDQYKMWYSEPIKSWRLVFGRS
jgi:hypothetical protein